MNCFWLVGSLIIFVLSSFVRRFCGFYAVFALAGGIVGTYLIEAEIDNIWDVCLVFGLLLCCLIALWKLRGVFLD